MIAAGVKLLPLALAVIALSSVAEGYTGVAQLDAAQVLPRRELLPRAQPIMHAPREAVDESARGEPAPATEETGLRCTLALLSDKTVKDLFNAAISEAYYVIEVVLSQDSSSVFAVTELELHPVDGKPIQPTSVRLIARQMSHKRKLMPAGLVSEVVLVPTPEGIRTWLFVVKNRLDVVEGKLPTGLQLFGKVSKVQFEMKLIQ